MHFRYIVLILLLACRLVGSTQFAMINSTTGSARALENEDSEEELILQNGEIVYILLIDEGTVIVDYDLGGEVLHSAAFSETDILPFYNLNRVMKVYVGPDSAYFYDRDLSVKMKRSAFVASAHQISWTQPDSTSDYRYLSQIDGHRVYGTDGDLPHYSMDSIHFSSSSFKGTLVTDILFEPNFGFTEIYFDEDRERYIVTTLGSDGAGSYAAYWIIDRNGIIEPVVTIPF